MKAKLEVNKAEFQEVVNDLEGKQTFANPSHLWKAVEETEWAKNHKPRRLTVSICRQRTKQLGLVMKTVASKRAHGEMTPERKAAMLAARKNRKSRAEKMKAFGQTFTELRREAPSRFLPLVDQAEKGSLRAALKLKCLDCTCYQPTEIKECPLTCCSLYPHRPYQKSLETEEAEVVELQEDAVFAKGMENK
jgi:hypothetical protein